MLRVTLNNGAEYTRVKQVFDKTPKSKFEAMSGFSFLEKPKEVLFGCMDSRATNFDERATRSDDSSCTYDSAPNAAGNSVVSGSGAGGNGVGSGGGGGEPALGQELDTSAVDGSKTAIIVGVVVGVVIICAFLTLMALVRWRWRRRAADKETRNGDNNAVTHAVRV